MPELPEVEITRRRIAPLLLGRRIVQVRTLPSRTLFLTRPAALRRGLAGRTVAGLERRGKYLLALLDDGQHLMLHLGMTGQLLSGEAFRARLPRDPARPRKGRTGPEQVRADRHTHLRLGFEDGGPEVVFRDPRKFGRLALLPAGRSHPRLDRLGIDALAAGGDDLLRACRGRRRPIKSLLLDQHLIAGLGNIYVDESLFRAGIRPTRRAGRLTQHECRRLARAVQEILARSIRAGGSSISDFVAPDGRGGRFQDQHRVHGRGDEPCRVCGTRIRRIVLAGRGTCFCPRCQR